MIIGGINNSREFFSDRTEKDRPGSKIELSIGKNDCFGVISGKKIKKYCIAARSSKLKSHGIPVSKANFP